MPPPNPADPTPFSLADPAEIERKLLTAGFSSVRTERTEFEQRYPSLEKYWAETTDLAAPIKRDSRLSERSLRSLGGLGFQRILSSGGPEIAHRDGQRS